MELRYTIVYDSDNAGPLTNFGFLSAPVSLAKLNRSCPMIKVSLALTIEGSGEVNMTLNASYVIVMLLNRKICTHRTWHMSPPKPTQEMFRQLPRKSVYFALNIFPTSYDLIRPQQNICHTRKVR